MLLVLRFLVARFAGREFVALGGKLRIEEPSSRLGMRAEQAPDRVDILGHAIEIAHLKSPQRPGVASCSSVVESANLATEAVVRAASDGYTLLTVSDANAYNATLYDNLSFNFIRDIAPVASIGRVPFVMVVDPLFAAKTLPEFVAYAKANPGKINMASLGPGSPSQLVGVLFKATADVDLLTVNYRGAGPALLDLMSSRVDVMFISVAATIGYIRSGKLRPRGVTTTARMDGREDHKPASQGQDHMTAET